MRKLVLCCWLLILWTGCTSEETQDPSKDMRPEQNADASAATDLGSSDLSAPDEDLSQDLGGPGDMDLGLDQGQDLGPGDMSLDKDMSEDQGVDQGMGDDMGGDDPLTARSDEFNDPQTLTSWTRIYQHEGWSADQLEVFDLGASRAGWLTMVPYTSTWYQDYRGVLVFKEIQGDFVVTTHVEVSNRAQNGAPGGEYSLAGIMVRTPRNVTPATWMAGGENYLFLSLGSANMAGSFQTEVKRTINSDSQLEINAAPSGSATIRVARLGEHFVMLIRFENQAWRVHRRYRRADMPAALQVGMTVYTDYANASRLMPVVQNNTQITDGMPDLRAQFDYYRFATPQIPANLAGAQFSDPQLVSDAELLRFLGF